LEGNGTRMRPKIKINQNKILLILSQIGVLFWAMAAIFWLMVTSNKDRIENDLKTRLDTTTQAMAAQLKANQVPFSPNNVVPGIFIINQTDGTVVVDRRNNKMAGQKIWEEYKTKIIYEMQKQKRGWVEYPDKSTWNFSEPKRIIRYISIDELNWILAIEDLQPSSLDLLKASVNPSICVMIFLIFVMGSGALCLMTLQYFDLIKRQISHNLEDNILSLSGEERLWDKSHGPIPKAQEKENEDLELPKIASQSTPDPIMEEIFHKIPVAKPAKTAVPKIVKEKIKPQEAPVVKETPVVAKANKTESGDMAVDVQHINSPVLKKMLQQFREK